MADFQRVSLGDRNTDQAFTALKKGAYLLKYGRRGKPKFCPFRLSADESKLIWYFGKEEKQLELCHVSKIIPGQRTAIFQRYPRPEKEYQSFSLIYNDRSLDLICKDKDEAEVWFVGLKALIARGSYSKVRSSARSESISSESPRGRRVSPSSAASDQGDGLRTESRLGKAFSDIISYTAATKSLSQAESVTYSLSSLPSAGLDNPNGRTSTADTYRVSLSSAVSSSSQGSCHEDIDSLGDVYIWGEGTVDGLLGGGVLRFGRSSTTKMDAHLPKALESTMVLDAQSIACGSRHAVLVTKQGEIFSWGEESGGRLGHGVEADVSHPKLIETLSGMKIEMVACGEYHSCAVTLSGDLYTWGDGTYNSGLLGHGSGISHSIPKKVSGLMEGIRVSYVSCGPWHTALITSTGQLLTFGDGTFGVLGHGDRNSNRIPREVETLKGFRTIRVACGVWHTAAVVEVENKSSNSLPPEGSILGKLFTWGNGDKGRLGHGDKEPRLVPECVAALVDVCFSKVACGHNLTVGLTTSGRVYTMGSTVYGQLGTPLTDGRAPTCIEGEIADSFVEEIACGSHHVAVLTSKTEVYTWGKGANGQLGHGDNNDRHTPTLVEFLKDKQVKGVVCGSNFTAVICIHKWVSCADNSLCSGCHNPFNFRRKRHNCYNCGLVFCKACSNKKSFKASLAPSTNKSYRVCDDCFTKLHKATESVSVGVIPNVKSWSMLSRNSEVAEKETGGPRVQGQLSKFFSVDSFNQSEGRNSKNSVKIETRDNRVFPLLNGNIESQSLFCSKATGALFGASKSYISVSVPTSRMVSRATSPVTRKACSPQFPNPTPSLPLLTNELILDDPKHNNESLSEELIYLKAQVEDLASKSQMLEAELEIKSRQLKEATALAEDEAECTFSSKNTTHVFAASDRPTVIYSSNKKLLYSNVNLKEVSDMCPFNSAAFPDSLAIAKEGELTIGTIDDIQKLHIRSIPLGEHARRICHQEHSRTFALCCVKYNQSSTEDSEMHIIRLLDDQTFEFISSYSLDQFEYGCSILSCSFTDDSNVYYCVGTAYVMPEENEPSKGRILVFVVEDGKLQLIAEKETKGAVYSLNAFNGKLLAAINQKIQLYKWMLRDDGTRELQSECGHHGHILALYVQTRGDFIVVGDLMKSISLLIYKHEEGAIEERARDYNANWMTAVEILDDDIYLGAENNFNLFTVRKNSEGATDEERGRLEVVGEYHLGEFVNRFRHGSLVMRMPDSDVGQIPTFIFGTVNGVIGVVASLPQDQYGFLEKLQANLRRVIKGVGGLSHEQWRSYYSEKKTVDAKNFLDGDLIESFLDLSRSKMEEISKAMTVPVEELMKRVEELTRLH